jgi:NADH-quinone oxidoreductase subunit G
VRQGPLRLPARHSPSASRSPWSARAASSSPPSWEKALSAAAGALQKAGAKAAAIAAGETTNEEAFLLGRLFRESLGSPNLSSSPHGRDALPLELSRALADPAIGATVPDLEFADTVLLLDCDPVDDAPILDLRIRKGVRRRGVSLAVASSRPGALDQSADQVLRYAPGAGEAMLVALDAALSGDEGNLGGGAAAAGAHGGAVRELAELLTGGGGDVVVVYSERLLSSPGAAQGLLNLASRLGIAGRDGAGLIEIPASTNGRGLREAGFAAAHGPGYAAMERDGLAPDAIAEGLESGELSTLVLWYADPLRTHPDRGAWERALKTAQTVIAHESVMTETVRDHADVVFPAQAYAEKEGTLTHPDGRLQRLRLAIGGPQGPGNVPGSGVRAGWQVIAELARTMGAELRIVAGPIASRQMFETVPFYAGLTLDEIGGKGVRWTERDAAAALQGPAWSPVRLNPPSPGPQADGTLRLGTFRSLWTSKEVDVSPALQFLRPSQTVEISPADAERLGVGQGDQVELGINGTRVQGAARLRAAVPAGTVFMVEGTRTDGANRLTEPLVELRRVGGPASERPSGQPIVHTPAVEGFAEAPQSAPLGSPPGTEIRGLNE